MYSRRTRRRWRSLSTRTGSRHPRRAGADASLHDRVGLWGPHRRQHRGDPHRRRPAHAIAAVTAVPVPNAEARLHATGRRLADRLPDPDRMPGHVPVHAAAPAMADHHEAVDGVERQRLHGEEVPALRGETDLLIPALDPSVRGSNPPKGPPVRLVNADSSNGPRPRIALHAAWSGVSERYPVGRALR